MANEAPRSTALLVGIVGVIVGLVVVSAVAVVSQLALKDQEIGVRQVYGDWNGLLSDAKTLGLTPQLDKVAEERFRAALGAFESSLARLETDPGWTLDPLVHQKRSSLHDSLEFCLQFLQDIDGWIGTTGVVDPLRTGWIHTRLSELDGLFGQDLANLNDSVNGLIGTSLRETSSRYGLLAMAFLLGLLALLVALLLRLQRMNRALNDLNSQLGEMVENRTVHLDEAVSRLEHTQSQLVASEKLAVLGNLAAGVAHELNTPLAALQSGSETVSTFFLRNLEPTVRDLEALSGEARDGFFRIVQTVFRRSATEFHRPDRAVLKALKQELSARSAPSPEVQAEGWHDLGLADDQALWGSLCTLPQMPLVLSLALRVVEVRSMAGVIVHAVAKASQVVQALRHYLEGSRSEEPATFELLPEWAAVVALLSSQFKKGVALTVSIPAGLQVFGTRERLAQVWVNLVNNALHALGGQGNLSVEAESSDGQVLIRVIDSGPGIPPEIQEKIFTPFFTTKGETGGLGLGLDICRKIVERNAGTLTVQSVPGRTEFVVALPDLAPGPIDRTSPHG